MDTTGSKYKILNNFILIFLMMQVLTVSVSVAASSISFGTWAGLWLIQLLIFRKEPGAGLLWKELKPIVLFIALYAIAEIISRVFAVYPDGALVGLKRLLLFLIFFVTVYKVPDRKTLHFLIFLVLCSLMIVSLYELTKYFINAPQQISEKGFSETRIDYLHYPLTSAEIKLMVLMAVMPLLFIKEKFFVSRNYLIVICIPIIVSLYLTQSRNVFLALVVCLIIFGLIKNWKALLIAAAVGILLFFILPDSMTSRYASIFNPAHGSNQARLTLWATGWEMFLANPLHGVGDNKIMEVYAQYKGTLSDWEHSHLHSNIFMILVTTGIMGFISFAGIFISIFMKQLKFYKIIKSESGRALILGSILMLISFHIAGVFEWSFGDHEVMTMFFFLMAVPFIVYKLSVEKKDSI